MSIPSGSVSTIKKEEKVFSRKRKNPFPGLRPFSIEESHLFFGREGQSDEVLRKLYDNKFVAIVGASGSGKSSFVYCGVIPILYGGFLPEIGTNWDLIVTRPGGGPIENLAEAIIKQDTNYGSMDAQERKLQKTILATLLRSSSLGLLEAVSRLQNHTEPRNTLVIVDQFEELFRFKRTEESADTSETLAFVNLLVETVAHPTASVYVAITMRSDFIGECAQFPMLTKLINDSNYLIPQMTREQKRAAIVGPVAVGGAKITPRLLQQILSDLGDNPDQLPIMAHALMRTYDYWLENHEAGEPIDLPHYESIGSMAGALSQHANEAYEELNTRQKEICAILFKCITEKTGEADGIRRPTKVGVIAKIAGCTEDEVIEIVEVFRKPGRSLLMPAYGIPLHANSIIDISHESLMRIWTRLKNWVDEEWQAVEMYLRLSDAASKYQLGKAGLWRPPDLQLALNWQQKTNPTLEWAERYHPAFERTMVFLESSRKAFETEQRVKEEMQRKRLQTARRVALGVSILAIVALIAFVYSLILKVEADRAREIAQIKEQEAKNQSIIAQRNAEEAKKQTVIAKQKESEALAAAEEARRSEAKAREALEEATKQRLLAEKNAAIARKQTKVAEEQKKRALESEKLAREQQQLAEIASHEAQKQRMLSIAQAMAVKSLQIADTTAKSLVALQAFLYNKKYEGNPHNHDVYDALYYANRQLYNADHNRLKGHTNAVRSIVYASDGKTIYTAGSDGLILKWVKQGEKYTSIRFYKNEFVNRSLAISTDNQWLAVAGEAPFLQLFDLKDPNARPKKLYGHGGQVWAMCFTPDNMLITSGSDSLSHTVLLRNLDTDKYFMIARSKSKIKTLAYDAASSRIIGGDENGQIHIWEKAANPKEISIQVKNFRKVHSVAVSSDGQYLAAGDEVGQVKLWNLPEMKLIANLAGHRARINDIKFNPQNTALATASFDGTVKVWDLEHLNEQPITLRDHNTWVWSMAFSPSGNEMVVGCVDNLVRVYPTEIEPMADRICRKLKRNMTPNEWQLYVAKDIPYEFTCEGLPQGKNRELE